MNFDVRNGHEYIDDIKELFVEYVQSLGAPATLKEFDGVEEKYKDEGEALYIGFVDNKPAGCVAILRVDSNVAVMKRLYVRPEFRNSTLGTALAELVVDEAKARGYKTLLLDSLPSMEHAKKLYTHLGFRMKDMRSLKPVNTAIHLTLHLDN